MRKTENSIQNTDREDSNSCDDYFINFFEAKASKDGSLNIKDDSIQNLMKYKSKMKTLNEN